MPPSGERLAEEGSLLGGEHFRLQHALGIEKPWPAGLGAGMFRQWCKRTRQELLDFVRFALEVWLVGKGQCYGSRDVWCGH